MPVDPDAVNARLAELRRAYEAQLPDRLKEIDGAWAGLRSGSWDPAAFESFHRAVHALAGSGAMFGFAALSDRARSLDRILKSLKGAAPDEKTSGLIAAGLASLKEST